MRYLMGIDLGTSGTKTVLFRQDGTVAADAQAVYPLSQPQNGWAEQNPQDWWDASVTTIRRVLRESAVHPEEIAGLGISGQMHGLVMLDRAGEVLRPAILWCDQRTGKECAEITQKVGAETLLSITANPALTGFTASKILWVRNHEPELYAKCCHILLPKDYLRYRLTGEFATEVSDASGMQLLDIPKRCWSKQVLSALEIPGQWLPRVYESPDITGTIHAEAAQLTGLSTKTAVVGGAGDNAAAAVGMGVVQGGKAFTTIGTSGVVFAHTDTLAIDPKGRVHTFCCAVPGAWHVMGVTQGAGLSLQWFRNHFCVAELETAAQMDTDAYALLDAQAQQVPVGANRLLYLPYLMGERTPHLDSSCRGVFFGLSAIHRKRDLLRAVMEGVTFSLRDCLEVLAQMGVAPAEMLVCGGGGSSSLWRQMLADVFALPVKTVASREGAALGAAILAGVGVGLYPSVQDACKRVIVENPAQNPNKNASTEYDQYYAVYQSLYPAMKESFARLAEL